VTNLSYNSVDYHVLQKGRAEKPAIIWKSSETGENRVLTYGRLLDYLETDTVDPPVRIADLPVRLKSSWTFVQSFFLRPAKS
jgi:hypothetical protein